MKAYVLMLSAAAVVCMACGTKEAKDKSASAADTTETVAVVPDTVVSDTTFTDHRDGKVYKVVQIGGKRWFAENLNYAAEGSKCYGEGGEVVAGWNENGYPVWATLSAAEVEANCAKYGRLYDWETALKAGPAGTHLPIDKEWITLMGNVGGKDIAGTRLKSTEGWNDNGNGTDDYGFSALPGGNVEGDDLFTFAGVYGYWWSATSAKRFDAAALVMQMFSGDERAVWGGNYKRRPFSVRCVQD
jgi:uncharacterized protein (TIGR02145 family)